MAVHLGGHKSILLAVIDHKVRVNTVFPTRPRVTNMSQTNTYTNGPSLNKNSISLRQPVYDEAPSLSYARERLVNGDRRKALKTAKKDVAVGRRGALEVMQVNKFTCSDILLGLPCPHPSYLPSIPVVICPLVIIIFRPCGSASVTKSPVDGDDFEEIVIPGLRFGQRHHQMISRSLPLSQLRQRERTTRE